MTNVMKVNFPSNGSNIPDTPVLTSPSSYVFQGHVPYTASFCTLLGRWLKYFSDRDMLPSIGVIILSFTAYTKILLAGMEISVSQIKTDHFLFSCGVNQNTCCSLSAPAGCNPMKPVPLTWNDLNQIGKWKCDRCLWRAGLAYHSWPP